MVTTHSRALTLLLTATLALGALLARPRTAAAVTPANDAFQRTWARTDQPVASGVVARTWMWGPEALLGLTETYNGRQRTVQYFDKSRMEINNPKATDDGLWYVTNGLLVRELITGDLQLGTAEFEHHPPSTSNVAGDLEDPDAPTYAALAGLLSAPAVANGAVLTQRIDHAGQVSNDPALASQHIGAAHRVTVSGIDHQVAGPFWDFMNASGIVQDWATNTLTTAPLFQNPFYATGYPITEAYWTNVDVQGVDQLVLLQCFERRCLTFTPANPDGWQVESGNVGQHYYAWRYGGPPVTPKGEIAFLSYRSPGSVPQLFVADASGLNQRQLTNLPASLADRPPVWAPDGTHILVVANELGFCVVPLDGSALSCLGVYGEDAAWSPDGTRIAFSRDSNAPPASASNADIYVVNLDGTHLQRLTTDPGADLRPAWSPDSRQLVFERVPPVTSEDTLPLAQLFSINADGTAELQLTDTPGLSNDGAAWSPDGTRIAFARSVPTVEPGSIASVDTIAPDGSDLQELALVVALSPPDWSPDGTLLLFDTYDGIAVMHADGSDRRLVVTHGDNPSWSSDGQQIVLWDIDARLNQTGTPNQEIYVVNVDGTGLYDLTNRRELDAWPVWAPVAPPQ